MGVRAKNVPLLTAIVATVVAVGFALVHHGLETGLPGMAALEGFSSDARFRLRGPRAPATDRIVIVGLDDETRAKAPEVFQTRRGYAKLFDALAAYEPKAIGVDLLFGSHEEILSPELAVRVRKAATELPADAAGRDVIVAVAEELRGDELLAAAMAANKRLVLGAFFVQGAAANVAEADGLGKARHAEVADGGGGGALRPMRARAVHYSLPMFAKHALGAGAVNTLRDDDGVTRRMPLAV